MPRYAALLRGVSPQNLKMSALKACLEDAGFTSVKTLLSSGNAVFDSPAASEAALSKRLEAAMASKLGRTFESFVRSQADLQALVATDPYERFRLPADARRVVTFLRQQRSALPALPLEKDGARILCVEGREVLSAYVVSPKGPVFMTLLEKTFGKDITTRTWDTVTKVAHG